MEITLKNLTKVFTDSKGKETRAVDNLDITIPSGKLIGLLGPSGCGKSTTLYMISGLLNPTEGRIFFGDDDVTDLSPEKRGIGLVFQNYALYPHMTVRQNIMFPLENLKVPKEEALQMTQEMANLVGIGDLLDRKPAQLSGGQQQRVAIARALVKKPRVLLLDEPLSNLDARLRLQTREEIRRIQRETGITTMFVTHDQEEAMSISDEIVVMNFGLEQQIGVPQHVYDDPKNLFVAKFLGTPPIGIYNGRVHENKLFIGDSEIFTDDKLVNHQGDVTVGIRPEGYLPDVKGALKISYTFVESIGRDISLVSSHPDNVNKSFRVIVSDDTEILPNEMSFNIRKDKCFVFNKESGERVL
ncbi:MAG: ABC transporter ATP-binding protein [Acholeplasmataceae bacterium]|jgi:multiple sugar transport system ATP-binding protein